MFHGLSRLIAGAGTLFGVFAAVTLTAGTAPTAALSQAAYQTAVTTSVTLTNAPNARQGSCFAVHVVVGSDAGTPQGTVAFSLDGTVVDQPAVPSGGSFTEVLGCSQSGLHAPLSRGVHLMRAAFVPSGNWAPSSANGRIAILGASVVPVGNVPHGIDAGLAAFGAPAATQNDNDLLRSAVTGLALGLGICVILGYRRRGSRI